MSVNATHWSIIFVENGPEGWPTVNVKFGLGMDQSVQFNINPENIPHICMGLLNAYAEYTHRSQEEI